MKTKNSTKTTRAAKRAPKDLTPKTRVAGGATVITNLANMRHEMLKSVAQNLRA
jgi:hypothetical protein